MPGEIAEKASHFTYLKDFRTQQCPDFLQHKCSHHRPYNCFSWHFVNQKRRRPIKKKDGTFNYSPDIYCSHYDETTGVCPYGDECALLHRVAGDVERRYHPRYYKTCMCVHETDSKGHCVKNGPHCAYAHGPDDLRMPVFDANEENSISSDMSCNLLAAHLEKDIQYNEDPNWNDPHYVLINYKTEQCHRPHRLCRQGYACPSFHNPRDKRRSPKVFKYRSTPCPNVKRGDEWGDPPLCDAGDSCSYCHTRTEQQFHPEIYKSSKCNDMVQTGYCPRGQFCAFAHLEKELNEPWDALIGSEATLSEFVEAALPTPPCSSNVSNKISEKKEVHADQNGIRKSSLTLETQSTGVVLAEDIMASPLSKPEPIGKRRTVSLSEGSANFTRSLGTLHERQPLQLKNVYETKLDSTKESFPNFYFPTLSSSMQDKSILSPRNSAPSAHYPAEDTVESVIVNALEEDLGFSGLNLPSYDRDDTESLCSSLGSSFPPFGPYFQAAGSTRPVAIPSSMNNNAKQQAKDMSGSFSSQVDVFGRSCPIPPIGSEHAAHMLQSKNHHASSVSGDMGLGSFQNVVNPQMMFSTSSHPLSPVVGHMLNRSNLEKAEEMMMRIKLSNYEENIHTLKQMVGELRKEVDDLKNRNKVLEEDKNAIGLQRDEAISQMKKMMSELSSYKSQRMVSEQCDVHEGRNDSSKAEVHEATRKDV